MKHKQTAASLGAGLARGIFPLLAALLFLALTEWVARGELTAETMAGLNTDQITLLAYDILREEVMDGGFVQLIYNGFGPFIFFNPFAKAVREWGLDDLAALVNKAGKLFRKYGREIERECSDEEFMALFEKYPDFDDLDDQFVENEEHWVEEIARYIDEHIECFATVVD